MTVSEPEKPPPPEPSETDVTPPEAAASDSAAPRADPPVPPSPPAASASATAPRPRPDLEPERRPVYRECQGYRLRLDPPDLARLRELPGARGKSDEELGETFFDGQADPLYLLDTNLSENSPADRDITSRLYGGGSEMRIKQEIVLGIGGVRALEAMNIAPTVFHMNEGHSAFLALEREIRGIVSF